MKVEQFSLQNTDLKCIYVLQTVPHLRLISQWPNQTRGPVLQTTACERIQFPELTWDGVLTNDAAWRLHLQLHKRCQCIYSYDQIYSKVFEFERGFDFFLKTQRTSKTIQLSAVIIPTDQVCHYPTEQAFTPWNAKLGVFYIFRNHGGGGRGFPNRFASVLSTQ